MAFRNPVHTLPAYRITGQLTDDQLPSTITDKTITGGTVVGAVLATRTSGNRVVIDEVVRDTGQTAGEVVFYTEVPDDIPGSIQGYGPVDGGLRSLLLRAPSSSALTPSYLKISYNPETGAPRVDVGADDTWMADAHVRNLSIAGSISGAADVSTTGASAAAGWTLTTYEARFFGPVVAVRMVLTRTGATITSTSAGNITDTLAATIPVVPDGEASFSFNKGGVADGVLSIMPNGQVILKTLSPTATIAAGDAIWCLATWVV